MDIVFGIGRVVLHCYTIVKHRKSLHKIGFRQEVQKPTDLVTLPINILVKSFVHIWAEANAAIEYA